MLTIIILLITSYEMVTTIQIGRVDNAGLITTSNSIWLYRQTTVNACLCTPMPLLNSQLLALNYFSSNRSCQLFLSSSNSPAIVSQPNSILILLQPLSTPCCSNLPLLLKRIQLAQQPSSTYIAEPSFLSINSANNLLSVMSYMGSRTLLDRTSLNLIVNTTSVGTQCAVASQFDNLFISSCDDPHSVRVYNETESGLQLLKILNMTDLPRQVVFLLNNTWMVVGLQTSRRLEFYSMDLTTNQYVYNQSLPSPYDMIWSLTKRNDTLIYVCFWVDETPVFTLSYTGSSWLISRLTATTTFVSEIPAQVVIDSCDRLWLVVYGFGIRIYDAAGQTLLASWSHISTTLDTVLILNTYDIFLGDFDNNTVLHFAPNLRCLL